MAPWSLIRIKGMTGNTYIKIGQKRVDLIKAIFSALPFFLLIRFFIMHSNYYVYGWIITLLFVTPFLWEVYRHSHMNRRLCVTDRGLIILHRKSRRKTLRKYYEWKDIKDITFSTKQGKVDPHLVIQRRISKLSNEYICETINIQHYLPFSFSKRKRILNALELLFARISTMNKIRYTTFHFLLIIFFVSETLPLSAQVPLTTTTNTLRHGDILCKVEVPYVEAGERGEEVVWQLGEITDDSRDHLQAINSNGDTIAPTTSSNL